MGILVWAYGDGKIPHENGLYFDTGSGNIAFVGFKTREDVKRVFEAAKTELGAQLGEAVRNNRLDQPLILPDDISNLAAWVSHKDENVHVLPVIKKPIQEIITRTATSLRIPCALAVARPIGVNVNWEDNNFIDGKEIAPDLKVGLYPREEAARRGLAL